MRYDIRLRIRYSYGGTSERARTLVRIAPSDQPGQQIIQSRRLTIDPVPDERRDHVDFFGNAMSSLGFRRPVDEITYTLDSRAERIQRAPRLDLSLDLADLPRCIATQTGLGATSPQHYLGTSLRVPFSPDIAKFARDLSEPGQTVFEVVQGVGHALHRTMAFDAQATTVDTTAAEAFANRHGVCQDFSHIMISALRSLGIPARYVSGFLRTIPPEGQARLDGADAMHAWVSAWCGPELGWVEFDPTNDCGVALDHIVVGYGRDYADVSPVRGVLRTSGYHASSQSVDVIPL